MKPASLAEHVLVSVDASNTMVSQLASVKRCFIVRLFSKARGEGISTVRSDFSLLLEAIILLARECVGLSRIGRDRKGPRGCSILTVLSLLLCQRRKSLCGACASSWVLVFKVEDVLTVQELHPDE
jgi:hypothetical protein